jgi:pyruvyltransferase
MRAYYYNNGEPPNPKHWSNNWGDIIAPSLVRHFSGSSKIEATSNKETSKLVSVGSVMGMVRNGDLVWGTGIIQDRTHLPLLGKPNFFAVRGPLTRSKLVEMGHQVPEVYGDPALLYPMIYRPKIEPTHEWGIIPHYIDQGLPEVDLLVAQGVKLIDICAGEKEFIDQLHSVKRVVSSSLHGLIAADAYCIPNARICLSSRLVGGDFKFHDYALAVNRREWKCNIIRSAEHLRNLPLNHRIDWNAEPLLDSAPWNNNKWKHLFT